MPPSVDRESRASIDSSLRATSTNETQCHALTPYLQRRTGSPRRTQRPRLPTRVSKAAGELSRATAGRSRSHQVGPGVLLLSMVSTASSQMRRSQFNPELILLKSPRNSSALPYSHWGGTDHEELGIVPETGFGPPILRYHRSLSLPLALSLRYLPTGFSRQQIFADDLLREAFPIQVLHFGGRMDAQFDRGWIAFIS